MLSITDGDVLEEIDRDGVKKLDLNLHRNLEAHRETISSQLTREVWATLIGRTEDRERIAAASNVSARLIISFNSKKQGIEADEFESMVRPLIEDDLNAEEDQINLVTGADQRIRRGDLILTKAVNLPAFAKTVQHAPAWEAMRVYLEYLIGEGKV